LLSIAARQPVASRRAMSNPHRNLSAIEPQVESRSGHGEYGVLAVFYVRSNEGGFQTACVWQIAD
jgi:hypothetical protein